MITVLGFDFGEKRIGLAVGNTLTGTSRALGWLDSNPKDLPWPAIEQAIAQWQPQRLLVGIPLNLEGLAQPMTRKARRFAHALRARAGLPVDEVDERFSSCAATTDLAQARASGAKRRRTRHGDIDAMAAAVIVQQWLDAA